MAPNAWFSTTLLVALLATAPWVAAQPVGAATSADTTAATPATPRPESAVNSALLAVDPATYTTQTFEWLDAQRTRRVPAKLYLASAPAPEAGLPLVVFSHGIGGSREGYSYIGRYLASQGYASLHVQHVGSDSTLWSGGILSLVSRLTDAAQESEALHRVQDVRYALDQILSRPELLRIDGRRIAVAGHSYGANTAMLVAGANPPVKGLSAMLRDERVTAAVLLSAPPFYGYGNPAQILSDIRIPTLHVTATEDVINIPGYSSGLDDRLAIYGATGTSQAASKVLAVFKEGSHSVFTDRGRTGGSGLNPKIKLATRQLALAFLNQVFSLDKTGLQRWQPENAALMARFENTMAVTASP